MNRLKKEKKEVYTVERIIGKKKEGKVLKYKVLWQGFSEKDATWEPESNLENVKDLVEEYEKEETEKRLIGRKRTKGSEDADEKNDKDSDSSEEISLKNKIKRRKQELLESTPLPMSPRRVTEKNEKNEEKSAFSSKMLLSPPMNTRNKGASIMSPSSIKSPTSNPSNKKEVTEKNSSKISNSNSKLKMAMSTRIEDQGLLETDKPLLIVHGKQHDEDDTLILCEVEWAPRKDGTKPRNSYYTNKELKPICPNILCEYYEQRLKFPSRKIR